MFISMNSFLPLLFLIIIAGISFAIYKIIRSRSGSLKMFTGIIFIILAIASVVISGPMKQEGAETRFWSNESEGNEEMVVADIIKYSGFAIGAIGLVMIFFAAASERERKVMIINPNTTVNQFCNQCGNGIVPGSVYCNKCGNGIQKQGRSPWADKTS